VLKARLYDATVGDADPEPTDPARRLAAWDLPVRAAFAVVTPADAPLTVTDDAAAAKVAAAFHVRELHRSADGRGLDVHWEMDEPGVPVLHQVRLRPAGRAGPEAATARQATNNVRVVTKAYGLPPDVDRVDFVLRPDVEQIKLRMTTKPVWGGELVIPNVPVKPPATRPVG
jgi:hypothetical protein